METIQNMQHLITFQIKYCIFLILIKILSSTSGVQTLATLVLLLCGTTEPFEKTQECFYKMSMLSVKHWNKWSFTKTFFDEKSKVRRSVDLLKLVPVLRSTRSLSLVPPPLMLSPSMVLFVVRCSLNNGTKEKWSCYGLVIWHNADQ